MTSINLNPRKPGRLFIRIWDTAILTARSGLADCNDPFDEIFRLPIKGVFYQMGQSCSGAVSFVNVDPKPLFSMSEPVTDVEEILSHAA